MWALIRNIDKTLAVTGIPLGLALTWLLREDYPELGITFAGASIIYLLFGNRFTQAFSNFTETNVNRRVYMLSSIAFFPLFTYSIATVLLNPELYTRPLEYFIVTVLLVCLVAIEISVLPKGKRYTYFTLLKLLLIGISLQWLPQFMFPSLTGIDVFGHSQAVADIVTQGHIQPDYSYARLPMMPLSLSATSLVTGLDYKIAGFFSTGLFYLMTAVIIYLIAMRLFNNKVGLISALVIIIADWFIHNGLYAIPNTLGIALVIFIVYMVFSKRGDVAFILIIFLMMAVLIMTHAIAAFVLAIILATVWLGVELYHPTLRQKSKIVSLSMIVLFIVVTLSYWLYISGHFQNIAGAISLTFGLDQQMVAGQVSQYLSKVDYNEILLGRTGLLIFYFIAVIGILAITSRWFRNQDRIAFLLAAIAIASFAFAGGALGFSKFLPDRFIAYSQILLSIPVAVGIIFVSHTFQNRFWKYPVYITLILVLSFFLITSPTANRESPLYSQNTAYRASYIQSEVQAAETLSQIYEGKANTDSSYKALLSTMGLPSYGITAYLIDEDFTEIDNLVIIREYNVEHLVFGGGGVMKLDYDPRDTLGEQGFSRFYDCGTVSGFLP
ncbi:ArnT family glycosyltransferase [Chloroflexota bacterium]